MRNLYLQARFWTYSMMYGRNHLMPPFTLNHTSGSGFVASFWTRLVNWWKSDRYNSAILWDFLAPRIQSSSQRYEKVIRRYQHVGRHRGSGRQTRSSVRTLRKQSLVSMENRRVFQELTADPSTEPIAHVPGSRAYRKLAWSRLNHEATKVRSRYYPGDPT